MWRDKWIYGKIQTEILFGLKVITTGKGRPKAKRG